MKINFKLTLERILLVLLIVIVVISNIWIVKKLSEKPSEIQYKKATFDVNPALNSLGFFTINDDNCMSIDGCENVKNGIRLKELNSGESTKIRLFIDYKNGSEIDIENVRAKLHFGGFYATSYIITASLSGNYTNTIYDTVIIENLPEQFNIQFVSARLENQNGLKNPIGCAGYLYQIIPKNLPTSDIGIQIGNLPAAECSRGLLSLEYLVTNTK